MMTRLADRVGKTTIAKTLFNQLAPHFLLCAVVELHSQDGSSQAGAHLGGLLEQLGAAPLPGAPLAKLVPQLQVCVLYTLRPAQD